MDPGGLYPNPVMVCLYQGVPKADNPVHILRRGGPYMQLHPWVIYMSLPYLGQ